MIKFFMLFLLVFLATSCLGDIIDNSFITKYEYGRMLYNNPRGIGCNKCHGVNGKGLVIAHFINKKGKIVSLDAPAIYKLKFKVFNKKLQDQSSSSFIMPTYFLTKQEIKSLYFYITNKSSKN